MESVPAESQVMVNRAAKDGAGPAAPPGAQAVPRARRGAAASEPTASAIIESPVGRLEIECSAAGVRRVSFVDAGDPRAIGELSSGGEVPDSHLRETVRQLAAYFAGGLREFTVPLNARGTEFQHDAWKALCTIPYGATISYEDEARRLGKPGAQRAVGRANATNPIAVIVPCHRVIEKAGGLRGYGGGLDRKKWLLDHEKSVAGTVLFSPGQ